MEQVPKILAIFYNRSVSIFPGICELAITITKAGATAIDDPMEAQEKIEDIPGNASLVDD